MSKSRHTCRTSQTVSPIDSSLLNARTSHVLSPSHLYLLPLAQILLIHPLCLLPFPLFSLVNSAAPKLHQRLRFKSRPVVIALFYSLQPLAIVCFTYLLSAIGVHNNLECLERHFCLLLCGSLACIWLTALMCCTGQILYVQ